MAESATGVLVGSTLLKRQDYSQLHVSGRKLFMLEINFARRKVHSQACPVHLQHTMQQHALSKHPALLTGILLLIQMKGGEHMMQRGRPLRFRLLDPLFHQQQREKFYEQLKSNVSNSVFPCFFRHVHRLSDLSADGSYMWDGNVRRVQGDVFI